MPILYPRQALSKKQDILERIDELRGMNEPQRQDRARIRAIMDGGREGVKALTGRDTDDDLPAANLIFSAGNALGQKLGLRPDIKVDPPVSKDSDRARKRAEKRSRIIETLDERSRLELQLPQCGRWLPGYGFVAWTIKMRKGADGQPYPHRSIRDPYGTYPGQWGIDQQPRDICFVHKVERRKLAKMYPDYRNEIMKNYRTGGGAVLLGASAQPNEGAASWANQGNKGVDVYEYWNQDGTWWIAPEISKLLEFVPNPIDNGPLFYVMKRFAFNKLIGQYDHVIGLQANIARLNLLSIVATQNSVFAETNILGDMMSGKYEKGNNAVNFLQQGSQVQKMNERVPFEVFQQIDRLENQLRKTAGYPLTDDALSPNSFVTGQGLQELKSSVDLEVREYQTVERHGLEDLDAKCLEFFEKVFPDREFTMSGVRKGAPFSEKFTPSTHIKGDYASRRVFGVMAGWDEPTKIVGGLNLLQAEVIDVDTLRENIAGLDDHSKIAERVRNNKIEDGLFETLFAMGQQGDPRAINALIGLLPEGEDKETLTEFFLEQEEEQPQQQEVPEGAPPDTQTVLSRLTNSGMAQGVQNVGRL